MVETVKMPQEDASFPPEGISCPAGWQARLIRHSVFPLSETGRQTLAAQMVRLCELATTQGLHGQLFLQNWKLSSQTGNDVVSANQAQWKLQRGLGIWFEGPPPAGWTEERLMDAAAAAFQGKEPRVPLHHLLQLNTDPQEFPRAVEMLTGRGVTLTLFSRNPAATVLDQNIPFYQSLVSQRYRRFPFFLPLLDGAGLNSSNTASLEEWMIGINVYLRESAEDGGILAVFRQTSAELIEPWFAAVASAMSRK